MPTLAERAFDAACLLVGLYQPESVVQALRWRAEKAEKERDELACEAASNEEIRKRLVVKVDSLACEVRRLVITSRELAVHAITAHEVGLRCAESESLLQKLDV